jgi:hypothetical protein
LLFVRTSLNRARININDEVVLPEKYDPWALSEEEKRRFISALADGFERAGLQSSGEIETLALPETVKAGLLKHPVYYDLDTDYDAETGEFWQDFGDDQPLGLFAQLPINFVFLNISDFFIQQSAAYLKYAKSDQDLELEKCLGPKFLGILNELVWKRALAETYSKPWYEYHINKKIESLIGVAYPGPVFGPAPNMKPLEIIKSSAQLGRLIEQYYWKFLLEKSAIRGEKTSQSAKTGGNIKASKLKRVHERWQLAAVAVWKENSTHTKMTVAKIVRQRLKLGLSAKHISRVIVRP